MEYTQKKEKIRQQIHELKVDLNNGINEIEMIFYEIENQIAQLLEQKDYDACYDACLNLLEQKAYQRDNIKIIQSLLRMVDEDEDDVNKQSYVIN